MTAIAHTVAQGPPAASAPAPLAPRGALAWARRNLFDGWASTLTTLVMAAVLVHLALGWWDWLVTRGVTAPGDLRACLNAGGFCWAFLQDKWRLILFGTYTYEEQWRPGLALALFFSLVILSAFPAAWSAPERRRWMVGAWIVALGLIYWLMAGGWGLPRVETRLWAGLPVTVLLAVGGMIAAFGLAILLALGRQSTMPVIRWICIVYIEVVRGVPLISLLFMANIMLPIMLPQGLTIPNLQRAQIVFILFFAAYMAEILRGGLRAVPPGQYAAARALGLTYFQMMTRIILPQALRIVIPSLVNIFIAGFKDTSLVVYVGMSDLLGAAQSSKADQRWYGLFMEAYLFIAVIYLIICAAMSWYSRWLERRLAAGSRR